MRRITVYLDDDVYDRISEDAVAKRCSKSAWVSAVLREKLSDEWPATVREAAGSWSDFPEADEIRKFE